MRIKRPVLFPLTYSIGLHIKHIYTDTNCYNKIIFVSETHKPTSLSFKQSKVI